MRYSFNEDDPGTMELEQWVSHWHYGRYLCTPSYARYRARLAARRLKLRSRP